MSLHHRPWTAGEIAERASFSALLVCVGREIAGGWDVDVPGGRLRVQVARPLATGLPPVVAIFHGDRMIDPAQGLDLLIARLTADYPATGQPLANRIRYSRDRIAAIVADRLAAQPEPLDFLAAEQAVIFGHWMHPAPKALAGMTPDEERCMTPDWRGAFRLHGLCVDPDLIETGGTDAHIAGFHPQDGRAILPVHPLVLDRLRRRADVAALIGSGAIRDLGPMGPLWHATSSVRTLWSAECEWMVKVSLPVTVTNSQRVNKRHELLAGAVMARHLAGTEGRFGPIRFVTDPAWMTLRLPDLPESGFEVILRENPYRGARGGAVVQVAGLVAPALPGRQSLLQRATAGHDPRHWFDAYLAVAVDPLLRLYDATGIAFEAHQQNVLLDLSRGLPCRADLRDNQGFYVAADQATEAMRAIPQLVYPRAEAEDALAYTLLVNQVFGVIHRMDLDGLLAEDVALDMLAARLTALADTLHGAGAALIRRWLTARDLPAKGNLLTQLGGVDELHIPGERAPCFRVTNPLSGRAQGVRHVA